MKKGTITIENINNAQFDPETGRLVIDSDKYCLSQNVEVKDHIKALDTLLKDPEYGVTKEVVQEVLPKDVTYDEFEIVKKEQEEMRRIREMEEQEQRREEEFDYSEEYDNELNLDSLEEEYEGTDIGENDGFPDLDF